jgi:ribonuclease VapC
VIVDSSALIAILFKEPDGRRYLEALAAEERPAASAVTFVETAMVTEGRGGAAAGAELDVLLAELSIETVAVDARQAHMARDAWRRYGKGRHPAGLNLGDCFAYALAKARGEPLLFKGEDFARTDVKAAI